MRFLYNPEQKFRQTSYNAVLLQRGFHSTVSHKLFLLEVSRKEVIHLNRFLMLMGWHYIGQGPSSWKFKGVKKVSWYMCAMSLMINRVMKNISKTQLNDYNFDDLIRRLRWLKIYLRIDFIIVLSQKWINPDRYW